MVLAYPGWYTQNSIVTEAIGSKSVLPVATSRGIIHAFLGATEGRNFPGLRWRDLRHQALALIRAHRSAGNQRAYQAGDAGTARSPTG
jgi:hypothetical protein